MGKRFTLHLLLLFGMLWTTQVRLHAQQTVGLFQNDTAATEGYTLLAPLSSTHTYLIDNCGRMVQDWSSAFVLGTVAYLLEDGDLLRTCRVPNADFSMGGISGRVEKLDWASNVRWHYTVSSAIEAQHHDAIMLPNGHVLMIVWEAIDSLAAVAQGRNPATLGAKIWPDKLIEVEPTSPGNGNVVWEWHAWDHLVQDFDSTKSNYGVVADHPELLDVNYYDPTSEVNWLHVNGIAYNPLLNQIALSSHRFDEVWIIDHSTTTQEAAGHTGGHSGRGGDLLYRYGNPQTYQRGTVADQKFFGQHNVAWVPDGDTYVGKLQVFNNGNGRPAGAYSTLEIFEPPMDSTDNYVIAPGQPFGPSAPLWTYEDNPTFYSQIISGLQRLPDDHTLVCEGTSGHVFELDKQDNIVWSYVNPIVATGPLNQGDSVANNYVFRATRYLPSYAGLTGQNLTPGDRLEGNPLPLPANCLAIAQVNGVEEPAMAIFPNPCSDQVTVRRAQPKVATVLVSDLSGRLVLQQAISGVEATIALDGLASGVYLLRLEGSSAVFKVHKLHD
jgi:hypothetical protein